MEAPLCLADPAAASLRWTARPDLHAPSLRTRAISSAKALLNHTFKRGKSGTPLVVEGPMIVMTEEDMRQAAAAACTNQAQQAASLPAKEGELTGRSVSSAGCGCQHLLLDGLQTGQDLL